MKIIILFCMIFVTVWSLPANDNLLILSYDEDYTLAKKFLGIGNNRGYGYNFDDDEEDSSEERDVLLGEYYKKDGVLIPKRSYDDSSKQTDDLLEENGKKVIYDQLLEGMNDLAKLIVKSYREKFERNLKIDRENSDDNLLEESDDSWEENEIENNNLVSKSFDDNSSEESDDSSEENDDSSEENDDSSEENDDSSEENDDSSEENDDSSEENEKENTVPFSEKFYDNLSKYVDNFVEQIAKIGRENHERYLKTDTEKHERYIKNVKELFSNSFEILFRSMRDMVEDIFKLDCDKNRNFTTVIDDRSFKVFDCRVSVLKQLLVERGYDEEDKEISTEDDRNILKILRNYKKATDINENN